MSINNLFSPNDFNINCNTLTCNNLIPGSITSNNAIYRLNIDPTSNPDPFSGGLIVSSTDTAAYNFALPLSTNQAGLGLGTPFAYDPDSHLSFNGTTITCNKAGSYNVFFQLDILSNLVTPNNICISQIIPPSDNIFVGPPAISAGSNFISLSSVPIGAIFNIGSLITASAIIKMAQGDQFDLKFFIAYDSCVIALTSCLCIHEL